jgi:hypothetical protein
VLPRRDFPKIARKGGESPAVIAILGSGADVADREPRDGLGRLGSEKPSGDYEADRLSLAATFPLFAGSPSSCCEWRPLKSWSPLHNFLLLFPHTHTLHTDLHMMAETSQSSAVQLAEQLSAGFAALSGEYQILFEQQRQLESKLSWAKQQVRSSYFSLFDIAL